MSIRISTKQVCELHKQIDRNQWHEGMSYDMAKKIIEASEGIFGALIFGKYYWPKGKSFIICDRLAWPLQYFCISSEFYNLRRLSHYSR